MIQNWVLIGLIVSAFSVSLIGAGFSILGIKALFTGAWLAVSVMAAALELAKFVIAAFLHQAWSRLNFFMKTYLTLAVVLLSLITSLGIFGFLSDAYQESSSVLEAETVKIASLRNDRIRLEDEIYRLNAQVDEIPETRISQKLRKRAQLEPQINQLNSRLESTVANITKSELLILDVKRKVGPLIYIAKAFNKDIDVIVKYLILAFVLVFDPLAICMVLAVSFTVDTNKKAKRVGTTESAQAPFTPSEQTADAGQASTTTEQDPSSIVKMRFVDEKKDAI
jgi:cell division protein FtsB